MKRAAWGTELTGASGTVGTHHTHTLTHTRIQAFMHTRAYRADNRWNSSWRQLPCRSIGFGEWKLNTFVLSPFLVIDSGINMSEAGASSAFTADYWKLLITTKLRSLLNKGAINYDSFIVASAWWLLHTSNRILIRAPQTLGFVAHRLTRVSESTEICHPAVRLFEDARIGIKREIFLPVHLLKIA